MDTKLKDAHPWKKWIDFCWIQGVCLAFSIGVLSWCFAASTGLVLLWMPLLVGGSTLLSGWIWWKRYKNAFGAFLMYVASASCLFPFLMCVPIVVERSLSCFIYFYAVEEGHVAASQIPQDFNQAFIQKRFDDGVEGNFLRQQDGQYVPTFRTKVFYTVYYPLGRLTHTLPNYQHFKKRLQQEEKHER